MKSYFKISLIALVALFSVGTAVTYAQMAATMPVIYNQNGMAINTGTGYLPAGVYFLSTPSSTAHQIDYYGNGTFYDLTTQTYGGSVSNPNGTAGVTLTYGTAVGLPNTGNGGDALINWMILGVSSLIAISGFVYLGKTRRMSLAR